MPTPVALTIRLGCEITYNTRWRIAGNVILRPCFSLNSRTVQETTTYSPWQLPMEELDSHGNRIDRIVLEPGTTVIRHDALVETGSLPEPALLHERAMPPEQLPLATLRYVMPSRYCDSDRLMAFSAAQFGMMEPGAPTVRAIFDWVHGNIEYRFGSGDPYLAASQVLERRYGVCRDFAHLSIALCRTFNIPARYVSGHLPDIGFLDSGLPMDFHAYAEVFLDGQWRTVDARFNEPRIGRINIAHGLDAADVAVSTFFGDVYLENFQVWNYQVYPAETLADPVDARRRLDGTVKVVIP